MYRRMQMIRLFEEQVNELYTRALMPGLAHLYVGEEAVAVGICEALRADDYITSTHRGHGHCVAKGASPDRMFAELLGKEAGYCKGKGGSMHIADQQTGNLGANAIVAGSTGIATGAAFSAKHLKTGQVSVCFFGEGALGQGVLYEVMNLAALWKLPVIYVCENNLYTEYTHFSETTAGRHSCSAAPHSAFTQRASMARTFAPSTTSLPASSLVRVAAKDLRFFCATPTVTPAITSAISAANITAPRKKSRNGNPKRDPIAILGDWLLSQKLADAGTLQAIETEVRAEMLSAVEFAVSAPYPDPRRSGAGRLCLKLKLKFEN